MFSKDDFITILDRIPGRFAPASTWEISEEPYGFYATRPSDRTLLAWDYEALCFSCQSCVSFGHKTRHNSFKEIASFQSS
ncbi:MAG: hypothetical protein NVS2B14_00240 [Chamaesiphon sp.]